MKLLMAVVGATLVFSSHYSVQASGKLQPAENEKVETQIDGESLIRFANNSSSLSDLLESYQTIGLIDNAAREDVLSFLKEQKIDPKQTLPPMKFLKGLYTTDGLTGFRYRPGGGLQTAQGRLIKVEKAQTEAQVYRMLFQAVSEDVKFSWMEQVLPKAYAVDRASRDKVALEALTVFPSAVLGWATNHLEARIALIYAWPVNVINLWKIFKNKGTVECHGSKYILITGYSPHRITLPENEPIQYCESLRKQGKLLHYGTKASCEYNQWAAEYMNNAFDTDEDRLEVTDKKLSEIFKPSSAPPCNSANKSANITKVTEALKTEFGKLLKAKAPPVPAGNQGRGTSATGAN